MSNCVLLKSYGRAGSHLVVDWFLNLGYGWLDTAISSEKYINKCLKTATNTIVKDHGTTYIPKMKTSKNIVLKRKDLLAQALSELVARRTNQWVAPFDNKKYDPFSISEKDAFGEIKYIIETDLERENLFRTLGLDYTVIFYEDFANNPMFLNSALKIENDLDSWTRPVSPYKVQDLVLNYKTLRQKYIEMQPT